MQTLILALLVSLHAFAIPMEGHKIMLAGPSPFAVATALKVQAQGGNVVDVAVAVGLTLAVTTPYYASLGGGGFAMVKMDGPVEALDFRESAPAATGKEYYKNLGKDASRTGGTAVAVPGVPAGLYALHQRFGKLKWAQLFQEPERLAAEGFAVSGDWVRKATDEKARFNDAGRSAFFKADGSAYKPGEILKQPNLAKVLGELKRNGPKGFYSGAVAKDLVAAVGATQGTMSLADLQDYRVRWLKPLVTEFMGNKVYLMPPPSSGGVIISTALRMMDKLKLTSRAFLSVDELHMLAEIESRSFRGRVLLGDPDFHQNPVEKLTGDAYIEEMAKSIDPKKASTVPSLVQGEEQMETTHFSVMDAAGHAVALTVTLNGTYGSGVVSPKFHVALNDEMDDFTTKLKEANMYGLTQGAPNLVEPGKRPLSSMSPALVEKDGKVIMSLGAPGGPRIVSAVLQGLYRVLGQNINIDSAIQAPRVHHQFSPNKIYVDTQRFSPDVLQALRERGHEIQESQGMGKLYIVRLRPDGILEGAFDARGEGAAGGL